MVSHIHNVNMLDVGSIPALDVTEHDLMSFHQPCVQEAHCAPLFVKPLTLHLKLYRCTANSFTLFRGKSPFSYFPVTHQESNMTVVTWWQLGHNDMAVFIIQFAPSWEWVHLRRPSSSLFSSLSWCTCSCSSSIRFCHVFSFCCQSCGGTEDVGSFQKFPTTTDMKHTACIIIRTILS